MSRIVTIVAPAIWETLIMVFVSWFFSFLIGFPVGIVLFITREKGLKPNPAVQRSLSFLVNVMRSLPFIILMFLLFPVTRLIVGKSIGTAAAIVPLSISAAPFAARLVEDNLSSVSSGVVEAARAMGASRAQMIKLVITEQLPLLISSMTLTMINLVGYSAMAGAVGGGGLGDIAARYGYQRNDMTILFASVIIIILIVESIQWLGSHLARAVNRK